MYTDGAKNKDCTAIAVYDAKEKISFGTKISNKASIFTAEAYAIISALDYIGETNNNDKWVILTDSMSVLLALANVSSSKTSFVIQNIQRKIYDFKKRLNMDINLIWTPAHVDVTGNEKADELARFITNCQIQGKEKYMLIPASDFIVEIRKTIKTKWKQQWEESIKVKGKWFREIQQEFKKPWFVQGKYVERKFYSILCRLRIGHGRYKKHLHRMKMVSSPICDYCSADEDQSLDHLFFECQHFAIQRLIFIDKLINIYDKMEIPRSIQNLLKNTETYKPIFEYVRTTFQDI
ncbi:uncharacterized protein LOC131842205 [Achroia grisella]|uniref:uncharacterized protein LOC131842205 n=1 Tax=Achroia grisella TaxID=688607 RepID=UPI0027D22B73|nr:uncharacterized protein LOC131842205 [Achroia grisella]